MSKRVHSAKIFDLSIHYFQFNVMDIPEVLCPTTLWKNRDQEKTSKKSNVFSKRTQ